MAAGSEKARPPYPLDHDLIAPHSVPIHPPSLLPVHLCTPLHAFLNHLHLYHLLNCLARCLGRNAATALWNGTQRAARFGFHSWHGYPSFFLTTVVPFFPSELAVSRSKFRAGLHGGLSCLGFCEITKQNKNKKSTCLKKSVPNFISRAESCSSDERSSHQMVQACYRYNGWVPAAR